MKEKARTSRAVSRSHPPVRRARATLRKPAPTERPIPRLELFQKEDDPKSQVVRKQLSLLGLDFIAHNVPDGNGAKHEMLIKSGGRDQIPFFVDHQTGIKLYDEAAILDYLYRQYGSPQPPQVMKLGNVIRDQIRQNADRLAFLIRESGKQASLVGNQIQDAWDTLSGSVKVVRNLATRSLPSRGNGRRS